VINCDSNGEEKAIVNNEWLGIKKKEEVRIVAIPNDNRELSCSSKTGHRPDTATAPFTHSPPHKVIEKSHK
jgi:hypothetical protein